MDLRHLATLQVRQPRRVAQEKPQRDAAVERVFAQFRIVVGADDRRIERELAVFDELQRDRREDRLTERRAFEHRGAIHRHMQCGVRQSRAGPGDGAVIDDGQRDAGDVRLFEHRGQLELQGDQGCANRTVRRANRRRPRWRRAAMTSGGEHAKHNQRRSLVRNRNHCPNSVNYVGRLLSRKWEKRRPTTLLTLRDDNRRDFRVLERAFDLCPVADDHDREVIDVDVLLGHSKDIGLGDGGDLGAVLLVVVWR